MNKLILIFSVVTVSIATSEAAPSTEKLAPNWSNAKKAVDDMQTSCQNSFMVVGMLASSENSAIGSTITAKLNSSLTKIANTLQPTYSAIADQTLTLIQARQNIQLLKTDLDGASIAIFADVNQLDPMLGNGARIYEMLKINSDTVDSKANDLYNALRS